MRPAVFVITALMFAYNALFAYLVLKLSTGSNGLILLALIGIDFIIIFYFVYDLAQELGLIKTRRVLRGKRRRR